MISRRLLALGLAVAVTACGSGDTRTPASNADSRAAIWQMDDDANVAYPTCPSCGAVVDRNASACPSCKAALHVEAKTIACPECDGAKKCSHCESPSCIACDGNAVCAICDGTGLWKGEKCPDCDGEKKCTVCTSDSHDKVCEFCADTHVCANCDGTGKITLK